MGNEGEAPVAGQGNTGPGEGVSGGPSPEAPMDEVLLTGEGEQGSAADSAGTPGEQPKEPGEPETYEFKMPEGFTLEQEVQGKFVDILKEAKIPGSHGQKLLDLAVEHVQRLQEAGVSEWRQQQKEWVESLKSDPEFGGPNLQGTIKAANHVLTRFGDADLVKDLAGTGFGNHAGLVKLLARIRKVVSEDRAVEGGPAGARPMTPGEIMFGKQTR